MRAYNANTFQLSSKAKEILLKFSTSHSLPASFVFRSKIALLASEGRSNPQISAETRIAYTTVCTWRNRFYNSAELIIQAEECTEPDESSEKSNRTGDKGEGRTSGRSGRTGRIEDDASGIS